MSGALIGLAGALGALGAMGVNLALHVVFAHGHPDAGILDLLDLLHRRRGLDLDALRAAAARAGTDTADVAAGIGWGAGRSVATFAVGWHGDGSYPLLARSKTP